MNATATSPDPRHPRRPVPIFRPALAASIAALIASTLFCDVAPAAASAPAGWVSPVAIDVPPLVIARRLPSVTSDWSHRHVEIELRVSALLSDVQTPQLEQLQIDIVPRQTEWAAIDYAPRTLAASDIEGPIEVTRSDERASKFSGTIDGAYGQLVTAHLGGSQDTKTAESTQFRRQPRRQTVTAAGTIARGRGVRYSFRASSTQPLEGERVLRIIYEVPRGFRGGLVDVSVSAHTAAPTGHWTDLSPISLPTLGDEPGPTAHRQFIVAVVSEGDTRARTTASDLITAERRLVARARDLAAQSRPSTLTSLVRQVTARIDADNDTDWLSRLLAGTADPYFDPAIRRLPTELRVLALDYNDLRLEFASL